MARVTHPAARVALSVLASVCAVAAGLLFLVTPISTGGFVDSPPHGADAMGLVVLLIASFLAVFAQLVACAALAFTGNLRGLGWAHGWHAFPVFALAGVAAMGALILWADRVGGWIIPLGLFCALFAPLLGSVMLMVCAWREPAKASQCQFMRAANPVMALSASCGLVMSALGMIAQGG